MPPKRTSESASRVQFPAGRLTERNVIRVVIDKQEELPWSFPLGRFTTERRAMPTGDYTVAGLEDRLVIERKSLGDFVKSVIHEWLLHRKRWYRMSGFDVAAVVVEADVADVMERRYDSDANPESVMGRAASITIDHGIPVFWWGPRRHCEPRAAQFLELAARRLGGGS